MHLQDIIFLGDMWWLRGSTIPFKQILLIWDSFHNKMQEISLYYVVLIFSKYAWALPLKNKTGRSVTNAFKKILEDQVPKNLQTDKGKEFYNSEFQNLMKKHNINHYSTYSSLKAPIVERFNRTLKENLWKQFSLQGNYKWIKILPALIEKYNNTKHRTIGRAPSKVNKRNEKDILKNYYNRIKIAGKGKF